MYRLFPLLIAASFLLSAPSVPAWAGDEEADGVQPLVAKRVLDTRARVIGSSASTRPSAFDPITGLHAAAFPIPAIGLWAQGHGFSLTRRSSIYELEGGAALRLDDGVHLTASYRMMGIDLGYDSDIEGADVEPGISAPFLGLAFDF